MARPGSCRIGLRSCPSNGAGTTREWIGGRQDEQEECDGDGALRREGVGAKPRRNRVPRQGDHGAEQGEDQDPEEHRALMVPPDAGQLVDERLRRMRVLDDVEDREIGRDVSGREGRERQHAGEHGERRRSGDVHEHRIVGARTPQRHGELHERQSERQRQGEMAGLDQHEGDQRLSSSGRAEART